MILVVAFIIIGVIACFAVKVWIVRIRNNVILERFQSLRWLQNHVVGVSQMTPVRAVVAKLHFTRLAIKIGVMYIWFQIYIFDFSPA